MRNSNNSAEVWPPGAGNFLAVTLLLLFGHAAVFLSLVGTYLDVSPQTIGYMIPGVLFPSLLGFIALNFYITRGSNAAARGLKGLALFYAVYQMPVLWLADEVALKWIAVLAILGSLVGYMIICSSRYQKFLSFFKERISIQRKEFGAASNSGAKQFAAVILLVLFNQAVCFWVVARHYLSLSPESLSRIHTPAMLGSLALVVPLLLWVLRGSAQAAALIKYLYLLYIALLLPLYWLAWGDFDALVVPSLAIATCVFALKLMHTSEYQMERLRLKSGPPKQPLSQGKMHREKRAGHSKEP